MFYTNFLRCVIVVISFSTLAFPQLYKDPNNLIKNGGFDEGATGWKSMISHNATGKSSVVDGQMTCTALTNGIVANKEFYDNQLIQENLTIVNGVTYFVSMDVKADVDREFQFGIENQNDEGQTQYGTVEGINPRQKLTTTMQTFTRTFTMTKPTATQVRLSISFGLTVPSTVTFDNMCIIDKSKMTAIRSAIRAESGNLRIASDSRGLSFRISDPAHFGFQIYSASGKVVANSAFVNLGSSSHYRLDYRSLGISSGSYIARTVDGDQQYSTIFSILP
jgi:hypothetical protein